MEHHVRGELPLEVHVVRLSPAEDLRKELAGLGRSAGLKAGFVMTAVGSLSVARLRCAGRDDATELRGDLEIVALGGTIAEGGAVHLHLVVADRDGRTTGGHLLDGCLVRTTAELVVGEARDLRFTRPVDARTGYAELKPERRDP